MVGNRGDPRGARNRPHSGATTTSAHRDDFGPHRTAHTYTTAPTTTPPPHSHEVATPSHQRYVAVVGGGLVGLSAAIDLRSRGRVYLRLADAPAAEPVPEDHREGNETI